MNVLFVHSSIDDAGLSPYAFRAYCHLARRANRVNKAWPGMSSMGRVCGFSESTAKRAVKELEVFGMVVVERSKGGRDTNRYILTSPSKWRISGGFLLDPVPNDTSEGSQRTTKVLQEGNPEEEEQAPLPPPAPRVATAPHNPNAITPSRLKTLWNTLVPSLNPLREVSAKHLRAAKARGNESKLAEVFTMVEASDFLSGRGERSSHTGWKCTLDWVLKPDKFANIVNGDYNTNKPTTNSHRSDSANAPGRYD